MLGRCQEAQEIANDSLRFDSFDAEAIYVRGLCLYFEVSVAYFVSSYTWENLTRNDAISISLRFLLVKFVILFLVKNTVTFDGEWCGGFDDFTKKYYYLL